VFYFENKSKGWLYEGRFILDITNLQIVDNNEIAYPDKEFNVEVHPGGTYF